MRPWLLTAALSLTCGGCDYTVLSTAVGEHVVYHWDADQNQLCGGTVFVADRFVEAIPAYYGLPPNTGGPEVEYLWGLPGTLSACSWHGNRSGCARRPLAGHVVIASHPFNTHELAHTAGGGYGQPPFVNEGFAVRWQSMIVDRDAWRTRLNFPGASELRAQLGASNTSEISYHLAHTWWVALETTYGPAKTGEFITELGGSASPSEVEAALQRVFGISLAESATLAEDLPELLLDDPACLLTDLPTFVWTGEPIVVDRGDSIKCSDDDIVNLPGSRVTWLFALEFPADGVEVTLNVSVAEDADPNRKELALTWCDGQPSVYDYMTTYYYSATHSGAEARMTTVGGRYVAGLHGVLDDDGSVELPTVVFAETSP